MRIHNFGDSTRVLLELVRKGKTALSVDWDPGSMAISLQDASGREGHFMYGEVAQRWNPTTSNAQSLLYTHQEDVKLIAAIYADFCPSQPSQPSQYPGLHGQSDFSGDRIGSDVYCPCTGPRSRGDAVHTTKSGCCYEATNDVNLRCWNQWCIGCCQLAECDAACVIGDYFCVCGRSGRECGGPCY